jgi:uncharacterized radical SAM protein YgiQ
MSKMGWTSLDIILISGDTYIDSSYNGIAIIGNLLYENGYKVGVIAQPEISSEKDIMRLGEPNLYWGISAGAVDSMVANYTASRKKRRKDDFTPGGLNDRRPDRACIAYTNLIKQYSKNKKPIVLGGIEASLRRIVHYDFWSNKLRKSILFDSKADVLVYGMGERPILELSEKIKKNQDYKEVRGLCYIGKDIPKSYIELPSFEEVKASKDKFIEMFNIFYVNNDYMTAKGMVQKNDTRYLIHNPPAIILNQEEIDKVYNMNYERDVHPYYKKQGPVKAMETIRNSITTHRGCYGECNFCSIALHQGRRIVSRSESSIYDEAKLISEKKGFKGYISDVGGPTANMYQVECEKKEKKGSCDSKRCIYPEKCNGLEINHKKQIELLQKIRNIKNVKKVFVASGIRYDMILQDKKYGDKYLREIIKHHVSGQMKIAPEHTENKVLDKMGKPGQKLLKTFKDKFYKINKEEGKKQFLTYYIIAAHPNCSEKDMRKLKEFAVKELRTVPEQVQIFTPTPSTYSTLMYYTEKDPFTGEKIFVEKEMGRKERQKKIIVDKNNRRKK